jgi:hypothetical protein
MRNGALDTPTTPSDLCLLLVLELSFAAWYGGRSVEITVHV